MDQQIAGQVDIVVISPMEELKISLTLVAYFIADSAGKEQPPKRFVRTRPLPTLEAIE